MMGPSRAQPGTAAVRPWVEHGVEIQSPGKKLGAQLHGTVKGCTAALRAPGSYGKRVPQPPRIKPSWLFKHKVVGMAPCFEGFLVDVASDGQSRREAPQLIAYVYSLQEGQSLADLAQS